MNIFFNLILFDFFVAILNQCFSSAVWDLNRGNMFLYFYSFIKVLVFPINPLSATPQNGQTHTIRRLLRANCVSVVDHFVRLARKGLKSCSSPKMNPIFQINTEDDCFKFYAIGKEIQLFLLSEISNYLS